jgi:hypothetical protein
MNNRGGHHIILEVTTPRMLILLTVSDASQWSLMGMLLQNPKLTDFFLKVENKCS